MECFIPSDLIQSVSDDLPFLEDDNDTHIFDAEGPPHRYIGRAVFWGAVIVAVAIGLLVLAVFYHCCMCFCCCCGKRKERKKSTVAKWECALLNVLVTLIVMGMIAAAIWANVAMNRNIVDSEDDIKDFLRTVDDDEDNVELLDNLFDGEEIRHGLMIAYLVVMFILLPLVIITVATTPCCKLDVPLPIDVMLFVFFIVTFTTAVIFGGSFTYLIILGDICIGFYTLAGESDCLTSSKGYRDELENFCNDAFEDGFVLFVLGCGLLLGLSLLQCCGSTYSGLLTGKRPPRRKESPTAPMNEPSAWETYGTNQFLGVTSDVLVVSETVQLSPMAPPPSYAEIVQQDTYWRQEGTDGGDERGDEDEMQEEQQDIDTDMV